MDPWMVILRTTPYGVHSLQTYVTGSDPRTGIGRLLDMPHELACPSRRDGCWFSYSLSNSLQLQMRAAPTRLPSGRLDRCRLTSEAGGTCISHNRHKALVRVRLVAAQSQTACRSTALAARVPGQEEAGCVSVQTFGRSPHSSFLVVFWYGVSVRISVRVQNARPTGTWRHHDP